MRGEYLKNRLLSNKVFALLVLVCFFAVAFFACGNYSGRRKNRSASLEHDDVVRITFSEGLNFVEVSKLLEENGVVSGEDFLNACNDNEILEKYPFLKDVPKQISGKNRLEGFLFPDTYNFFKNEKPSLVLNKFLDNFEKKISKIKFTKKSKYGMYEILTIASLLQLECTLNSVNLVSSVIYNRLNTLPSGMSKFGEYGMDKLQIDSARWYPSKKKTNLEDYDTYKIHGLPPGPVCSPGLDFILGAANPEKSDYYYFCMSENGKTFFAKNFTEHKNNLKRAGLI